MMTTNLFVIANVKQLRTGGSFRNLLPFFRTTWGVGVLNSAIFNSFHNWVEFGTILEGLQNFGGGVVWTPPPPPSVRHWAVEAWCHSIRNVFTQYFRSHTEFGEHLLPFRPGSLPTLARTAPRMLCKDVYSTMLVSCLWFGTIMALDLTLQEPADIEGVWKWVQRIILEIEKKWPEKNASGELRNFYPTSKDQILFWL